MENEFKKLDSASPQPSSNRRKFLGGAAAAAGVAALAACGQKEAPKTEAPKAAAAPAVAVKPEAMVIKMQGAWSATDIFNEMAVEFVKRVNEMSGGRLKVDYLIGGAVVKP
ncbi:MAG: twin-arginine translocation signal domain-containing protein, partial [Betaproteobacteria bacterium]